MTITTYDIIRYYFTEIRASLICCWNEAQKRFMNNYFFWLIVLFLYSNISQNSAQLIDFRDVLSRVQYKGKEWSLSNVRSDFFFYTISKHIDDFILNCWAVCY